MQSSKQIHKGKFKNLPRIEPDSELESDEETARRNRGCTCPFNIREEDSKESNSNQEHKSGGAAYHAQLTFDNEARLSSANIVRLQAHKIECMLGTT